MTWWLADNADMSVRIIVEDRAQRFSPMLLEAVALEAVTANIEQPRTDSSDLVLSFHADSLSADDITDVVTLEANERARQPAKPDVTHRLAHVGFAFGRRGVGR